jgi:hypothetical protein
MGEEHERIHEEHEREADDLERQGDKLDEELKQVKGDWEAKKSDDSVPGAQPDEDERD